MAVSAHAATVRALYKRILVLHRFLPIDLKALGDQYVKDEFRRHKSASAEEAKRFMAEWQVVKLHPAAHIEHRRRYCSRENHVRDLSVCFYCEVRLFGRF